MRTVYTPSVVERIHGLLGRMHAREIAATVGVSLPSLKSWARDKKISLAPPISKTICAQYNRLRQRAHQLGLRLSAQDGRISLWVSVAEDLTFVEAAEFLKHANRKTRFMTVEAAFERGIAQLSGTAAPPVGPLPKLANRRKKAPPKMLDIAAVYIEQPNLRALVSVPVLQSLRTLDASRQ